MNARALIQQWEGSLTQTSQLPQNEVEDSSPLPICSAERPIHVIVKTMPLVRASIIVLISLQILITVAVPSPQVS